MAQLLCGPGTEPVALDVFLASPCGLIPFGSPGISSSLSDRTASPFCLCPHWGEATPPAASWKRVQKRPVYKHMDTKIASPYHSPLIANKEF